MSGGKHYYTDEKNTQIVIALLKAHGIRDIVISPGGTNDCFVLSVQDDADFRLYSAVDERHAGYLACGIAQESGQPVVINCTGATASRNYMSALTEAYYRKLPLIALTCSQHSSHIGHLYPQMTDRTQLPSDIVKVSVQCPIPHTVEEEWACQIKINQALLETRRHGGGPVHINLETAFCSSYTTPTLPVVHKVTRILAADSEWPTLDTDLKIAVWVGSHQPFTNDEVQSLEQFVQSHNAVVLTDLTSNYAGANAVRASLILSQQGVRTNPQFAKLRPDLIMHIGEVSGDYPSMEYLFSCAPVWRINEDGELRDRLHTLSAVFEMPERVFFSHYATKGMAISSYYESWCAAHAAIENQLPELPFSNLWIAKRLSDMLPVTSVLHLGILNPLRCWNLTNVRVNRVYSTVGGFGIDGGTSAMLGSALVSSDCLHFGVFGDLSFFYDLNTLGSRHITKNLRILLINNGEGAEFSVPGGISSNPNCGVRVHDFIAAKGHNGCQSESVVRHLSEDLGFVYLSASDKVAFESVVERFVSGAEDCPIVFECFTQLANDCSALESYNNISPYKKVPSIETEVRKLAGRLMPARIKNVVKAALRS